MKLATIFVFVAAALFLGSGISSHTLSSVLPSVTAVHAEEDMEEPAGNEEEMTNEETSPEVTQESGISGDMQL
ncbi:MAG: hypothetical protein H6754_06130 [Candidatus Omnitrophica bacterium]|nr:hypothetical protein [Candidatus Omnitrophota bacterium]